MRPMTAYPQGVSLWNVLISAGQSAAAAPPVISSGNSPAKFNMHRPEIKFNPLVRSAYAIRNKQQLVTPSEIPLNQKSCAIDR
ncbi:MAG: hypothetical protein FOGNACKC_05559 [Anaerolineae bacterium]|nr:hypothetical protein [Anaerolineae bacterium]